MSTKPDPIDQFFIDLESWWKQTEAKIRQFFVSIGLGPDKAEEAKVSQAGETTEASPEQPRPPKAKMEDRPEEPAEPVKPTNPPARPSEQRTYPEDPQRRGLRTD